MVSKNNQWQHLQASARRVPHYGLRKLSVGVASVLLSTTLYMGVSAHADTVVTPGETTATATTVTTPNSGAAGTTGQATGSGVNATPNSGAVETNNQATGLGVNAKPNGPVSEAVTSQAVPSAISATSENPVDSVADVKVVSETPASNATQNETVDSKWTLHYVNQADHKQELKAPTVITLQYTRTNTSQSDGTTQYGDWSYVPGSFKQTGTPITVKDSNNPVKQDNVDKNGENFDVFTITAMYPTVAGYVFYNGINGTRLRDNLRNNERQADSMSKDFYAEYDVAKPTRETVGSQWRIHYIDSTNREHELKAPTVIDLQYTRTNTPQSDGTIQHGDWSYVPGSFKLTGTPITVKDSDNPVKQDNTDKNGKNYDIFTIIAMYPIVAGYNFHDGINNARLHDYLLKYDPNGNIQTPTMGQDFDVEYDPISERSVAVKFVDDQSYDWRATDHKKQVGQAITLTGRDGDTVNLNLTVPDKYKLADGQQLPTTYTFAKGSGDVTIHLVHKVVQREAVVNVKLVIMTGVGMYGTSDSSLVMPQTRWRQLGDGLKHGAFDLGIVCPSVEVGTLKGHVNYDVVDNSVVSLGDDWTTLNLGGHTYQLPNGDDVVNGVTIDSTDSWGQSFRETALEELKDDPNADPDYITRPWHAYLSVNVTNGSDLLAQRNLLGLQGGLAGNEPNALAKANGDRAATAVEMTNKTIDVSFLEKVDGADFSEQDGQLQSTLPVPVVGVYVPYVEKTATRTINVTTPDGKTTTVKQTATLEKQVNPRPDAHPAWTTGEWTSYDVPTIPGYTASQLNVAKETVTGATSDQTVNITYTANPQTATVVYQTEDGTPVHTTTVNGQAGQTVKVSSEVPAGWKIINGKVPSEIIFGPNGTPQTVVTIAHQHVTVDPDHPQNNGTRLPDNSDKTFSGVEVNDLNKIITRTIKVTTPDGQTKTVAQTAKLTRTADVDEVTGEVTYGKWTTGKWDAYEVPMVPGYTASQNEVLAAEVTSDTTDQTIDISYTANSQTIHINYVDSAGKTVRTTAVTGKTGETVNLNLTVPDKYQLADGQQLPTTYTFTAGGGDVTIHLSHKVVQREASVDVQVGFMTLVDLNDDEEPGIVVTQNQWTQLDDEIKKSYTTHLEKVDPTVGVVGTLTGHVNYDLVDNKVVSFADDWTSLNLGGQTYQMPDGTDVVNGVLLNSTVVWGEKLKELFLKGYPDTDPDYATYSWHGYLSVNKSNIDSDYAGFRLVGNEPNALAKVTDDRAATAVEMTNKPIDLSLLQDRGGLSDFNEQNGQLRAKAIVPVAGMYIPYVEKTATRTINVTTPDGKTTSVKQTATLAKQVTEQEDAHPDWTTGEWTSYDVPTIPGYTASQSSVAKEVVTGTTKDQTVNITYTANAQTSAINYMINGAVIKSTPLNGVTDQTLTGLTYTAPDGYEIVEGQNLPTEYKFKAKDNAPIVVQLVHKQQLVVHFVGLDGNDIKGAAPVTVDGVTGQVVTVPKSTMPAGYQILAGQNIPDTFVLNDNDDNYLSIIVTPIMVTVKGSAPVKTGDIIPNTNGAKYPAGLTQADLIKTITRTIHIAKPNGKTGEVVQMVKFSRDATVNAATGEISYDAWVPSGRQDFEAYTPEVIDGFTVESAPSQVVTPESQDSEITLTYKQIPQAKAPIYIDNQGHALDKIPDGYHVVAGQTPLNGAMLLAKDVVVKPVTVEFVTRTVTIKLPNNHVRVIHQRVRKGTQFGKVAVPHLRGYKIVVNNNASLGRVAADQDMNLTVTFEKL